MKIYSIKLMGGSAVLGSEEDVARIIQATSRKAGLVRVRGSLINPASISSITRSWEARDEDLEKEDTDLGKIASDQKLLS